MVGTSESQGTSTPAVPAAGAATTGAPTTANTPYIAVHVDSTVQVPMEYVKNNEIVLNVGFEATSALQLGNEFVEFKAPLRGVAREIVIPVDHVLAIYARENGQGMAFPMPVEAARAATADGDAERPTRPSVACGWPSSEPGHDSERRPMHPTAKNRRPRRPRSGRAGAQAREVAASTILPSTPA